MGSASSAIISTPRHEDAHSAVRRRATGTGFGAGLWRGARVWGEWRIGRGSAGAAGEDLEGSEHGGEFMGVESAIGGEALLEEAEADGKGLAG